MLLSPQNPNREDAKRKAFVASQLSDLETKIEATQEEIAKKQSDLANMFSARQIADTQTQITALQDKLATLQANYAALLSTNAGRCAEQHHVDRAGRAADGAGGAAEDGDDPPGRGHRIRAGSWSRPI